MHNINRTLLELAVFLHSAQSSSEKVHSVTFFIFILLLSCSVTITNVGYQAVFCYEEFVAFILFCFFFSW